MSLKTALRFYWLACAGISLVLFAVVAAHADEKSPLTNAKALNLLVALRGLEGHTVIIKQNGTDTQVQQPWEFGSAVLRLRIKRNIQALEPIERAIKEIRESMLTEAISRATKRAGTAPATIEPNSPEFPSFLKQLEEVLEKPVDGAVDLVRIRASELKLDKNEIGASVLTGLDPILDDDVTPK